MFGVVSDYVEEVANLQIGENDTAIPTTLLKKYIHPISPSKTQNTPKTQKINRKSTETVYTPFLFCIAYANNTYSYDLRVISQEISPLRCVSLHFVAK